MSYYLILALILLAYMSLWFLISIVKKRNDIADIAWGLGFILMAWSSFPLGENYSQRGLLTGLLISIWGVRLASHIFKRNRNKTEDYRYAKWRKDWGRWFYVRSFVQVYLLQGALLYLISLPIFIVNRHLGAKIGLLDFAGLAVWLIGFAFEAIGDAQLATFINNPANKGKLMQSGLWQYTRHPNYFGEVTMWWGIWLISLSSLFNIFAIISPLTISFLILKVSGIPMLEKKYEGRKDFEEYKKKTSVFFPLPPRKND